MELDGSGHGPPKKSVYVQGDVSNLRGAGAPPHAAPMTRCHGWAAPRAAGTGGGRGEAKELGDEAEDRRATVSQAARESYSMDLYME